MDTSLSKSSNCSVSSKAILSNSSSAKTGFSEVLFYSTKLLFSSRKKVSFCERILLSKFTYFCFLSSVEKIIIKVTLIVKYKRYNKNKQNDWLIKTSSFLIG